MIIKRTVVLCSVALAFLALTACSGSKVVKDTPAELQKISSALSSRAVWSASFDVPDDRHAQAQRPLIMDEIVYVADATGLVLALGAEKGKKHWSLETEVRLSSSLGGDENILLVGGHDGEVIAISKQDGTLKWRSQVSSEVLAAPTLVEDVVVVHSIDGKLAGLDLENGQRLWVYESNVPALTLHGIGQAVGFRNQVMAGFSDGKIVALSVLDGQVLWQTAVAVPQGRSELERLVDVDATPVVKNGVLYSAAFQGRLVAMDVQTGNTLWSREMSVYEDLAVNDAAVYVTDDKGSVWAFDLRSGTPLWRQQGLFARDVSAPVVHQGYLSVGDFDGYVHWLRLDDGEFISRSRPFSSKERVVLLQPDSSGALYALNAKGKLKKLRVEKRAQK